MKFLTIAASVAALDIEGEMPVNEELVQGHGGPEFQIYRSCGGWKGVTKTKKWLAWCLPRKMWLCPAAKTLLLEMLGCGEGSKCEGSLNLITFRRFFKRRPNWGGWMKKNNWKKRQCCPDNTPIPLSHTKK